MRMPLESTVVRHLSCWRLTVDMFSGFLVTRKPGNEHKTHLEFSLHSQFWSQQFQLLAKVLSSVCLKYQPRLPQAHLVEPCPDNRSRSTFLFSLLWHPRQMSQLACFLFAALRQIFCVQICRIKETKYRSPQCMHMTPSGTDSVPDGRTVGVCPPIRNGHLSKFRPSPK